MFKLISILIINGIVLLILISCHNKTNNSRNAINLEYENSTDSLNSHKMDASHFINSIEPGETIVEEKLCKNVPTVKIIVSKKACLYR